MLGTLFRRVTIRTLDTVVDQARRSERAPLRLLAGAIDRVRPVVGLDRVRRDGPLPPWKPQHPDRPMWESDRKKLHKWQVDQGIIADGEATPAAPVPAPAQQDAPVKVYFKRGCPHARAALDLLREREIPFDEIDFKDDVATQSWLQIVTGRKTSPQIFVKGEHIGGYDELRALDQKGELLARVGSVGKEGRGRVKLPVVHPERSPFEGLEVEVSAGGERLEGQALIEEVERVLDECRPLVKADGGDIELLDVVGDVVHVRLTGNCIGCPSSQATLRHGIERRLKARIPQLSGIASPQL